MYRRCTEDFREQLEAKFLQGESINEAEDRELREALVDLVYNRLVGYIADRYKASMKKKLTFSQ